MTFSELKVTRQYLDALEDMGIVEPTEIQAKAIPRIRAGQDVIGIAQTGTGKTLAFLLPVMAMLSHAQGKGPRCVIFTPAKELALQIADVAQRLAVNTDLRVEVIYGALDTGPSKREWKPVVIWLWPRLVGLWNFISEMLLSPKTFHIWSWTKRIG